MNEMKAENHIPPSFQKGRNVEARLAYAWLFGGILVLSTCFLMAARKFYLFEKSTYKFILIVLAFSLLYVMYVDVNRYLMKRVEGFRQRTVKTVSIFVLVTLLTETVMTVLIQDRSDFIYYVVPWPFSCLLAFFLIFYLGLFGIVELHNEIKKLYRGIKQQFSKKAKQWTNQLIVGNKFNEAETRVFIENITGSNHRVGWKEIGVWIYLYTIFIYVNAVFVRLKAFGYEPVGVIVVWFFTIIFYLTYVLLNIVVLKPHFPNLPFKLINTILLLVIISCDLSFLIYSF